MKLGKLPATRDERDLLFTTYREAKLVEAPVGFGHASLVKSPWGMLGNDQWGDCAWAGPGHEHMLTSAAAGKQVSFTTDAILQGYASTGFDPAAGPPGQNKTDRGSDVRNVLRYRQTTGLVDVASATHKIGAYVALEPGNWEQLLAALYLFETVGVGIQFPSSAMDQFNAGKPWTVVAGAEIEGGHYIPIVGRPHSAAVTGVTWGAQQAMSSGFYHRYCDEAWAILSPEMLTGGKTLEGFDLAQLQVDLGAL